ncbi:carbohydrate kinase family protein [Azospirillum agricola]|uniref:carbohydrate kinase family protein n=1 Tax=Azospirillum agricola TaxID=1720247 RepID=UPI000A0F1406|nr:PfkB family carbohydrate kinase [Azospirillum agricola]SMH28805.1 Sugar or nucleoside kinase, ribokinase family [Azospirillum lipoferum]
MPTNADTHGILCLGRLYCDLLFTGLAAMPELGRERFAEGFTLSAGGGAYITAAHLAACGRRAFLASRLGLDSLSCALEAELAASGVDLGHLERSAGAGPQPTVALVRGSERAFVSRRAGSARPATLDAALADRRIRHLHIAEYATLHEIPGLVAQAKARGLTLSLDPSWDDSLIRDPGLLASCAGIDLFFPNEEELRAITGRADVEDGLESLADAFPLTVVKRGGAGALLAAAGGLRLEMAAETVPVVDTTGAGDAFNAGFLDAWLDGHGHRDCLATAIATGSASVGHAGGAPRARRPETS